MKQIIIFYNRKEADYALDDFVAGALVDTFQKKLKTKECKNLTILFPGESAVPLSHIGTYWLSIKDKLNAGSFNTFYIYKGSDIYAIGAIMDCNTLEKGVIFE